MGLELVAIIFTGLFALGVFTKPDPKSLKKYFKTYLKQQIQQTIQPTDIFERFGCRLTAGIIKQMSHVNVTDYFAFNIGVCVIPEYNKKLYFLGAFNAWNYITYTDDIYE